MVVVGWKLEILECNDLLHRVMVIMQLYHSEYYIDCNWQWRMSNVAFDFGVFDVNFVSHPQVSRAGTN